MTVKVWDSSLAAPKVLEEGTAKTQRDGDTSETQPSTMVEDYKVYPMRWFVLSIVIGLALSNAMMWQTYTGLTSATASFYCNKTEEGPGCQISMWTNQIFQLVGCAFGIIGMYVTDRHGIRPSALAGTSLNFLGGVVRLISAIPAVPLGGRAPLLYIGTVIAASAQPFFLVLSPKVAECWFPARNRALANVLSFVANPLGTLLGSLIPVQIVREGLTSKDWDFLWLCSMVFDNIPKLSVIPSRTSSSWSSQPLPSSCLCVSVRSLLSFSLSLLPLSPTPTHFPPLPHSSIHFLLFLHGHSNPPTPPSASVDHRRLSTKEFFLGVLACLKNPHFYSVLFVFGIAFAQMFSFFIAADAMFTKLGYSGHVVAYLIVAECICGTAASLVAGAFVDRTKRFKEVIQVCMVGFTVVALSMNFFCRHHPTSAVETVIIFVFISLMGICTIPVAPIGIELGIETTFPVQEATSSGILVTASQLILFLVITIMNGVRGSSAIYKLDGSTGWPVVDAKYWLGMDVWCAISVIGAVLALFGLRMKYNRVDFEHSKTAN